MSNAIASGYGIGIYDPASDSWTLVNRASLPSGQRLGSNGITDLALDPETGDVWASHHSVVEWVQNIGGNWDRIFLGGGVSRWGRTTGMGGPVGVLWSSSRRGAVGAERLPAGATSPFSASPIRSSREMVSGSSSVFLGGRGLPGRGVGAGPSCGFCCSSRSFIVDKTPTSRECSPRPVNSYFSLT